MQTIELPSGETVTVSGRLSATDKAYLGRVLGIGRATPTFRAWTDPEGRRGLEMSLAGMAPLEAARPVQGEAGGKPPHAQDEAGLDF